MVRLIVLGFVSLALVAGCSSGSGSTEGAATSAATADAGAPLTELLVDEGTFTVPAGEEVVYCVRIPMPAAFKGRQLAMTGWDSNIASPMHHYFMFYDSNPTAGTDPVPCKGTDPMIPAATAGLQIFNMGTLLLVAGTGQDTARSNPGYGALLDADGTFITNHHVINASSRPVTVNGQFKLQVADAATVAHPTRALSCQTTDISLPAQAATDITATCTAPFDLDIVSMSSHAHQDLVKFETRLFDGAQTQPDVLYTSTQWDSPAVLDLASPLHLKAGQGLTFTCHFDNKTGKTIGFGLTADAEMCGTMARYAYPVTDTNRAPPMLGGTVISNGTPVEVSDKLPSSFIPLF